MRINLITGPGGHMHGWGDRHTTRMLAVIATELGHHVVTLFVTSPKQLRESLANSPCDLAWSSLYHLSKGWHFVGDGAGCPWVFDMLDRRGIPYVGSGAACMRVMLDKVRTSATLRQAGIAVPRQWRVDRFASEAELDLPAVDYPVFVKPRFESESSGITESSVATTAAELRERVAQIHCRFQQSALIEEYLPGREFTVSMIGNGPCRRFEPIENIINPASYERFPVLTATLKTDGWIDFSIPHDRADALCAIADAATSALGCLDHVRVDVREDGKGQLKVIDVNGIPGLNPNKSRSIVIQTMYGVPRADAPKRLIAEIIAAAASRQRVDVCAQL